MTDPEILMEEAAIEQMVHPDLYEDDPMVAGEEYEERTRRTKIVNDIEDNPWE